MKKILVLLLLMLTASAAFGQAEFLNIVSFENNTSREIMYLFFSPADSDYWGPDVLGDTRTLGSGEYVEFFISYPEESNNFDFLAIDDQGTVYEIYEETITDGYAAEIVIDKRSRSDSVDLDSFGEDLVSLELTNSTDAEIYYLFVSPADSQMYGIDFMDSETTMMPGDSVSILLFDTDVEYDVQGMDGEDNTYSFSLTIDPDLEYQYVEIENSDLDY